MRPEIALNRGRKRQLAAAGGVIGALLASTCCVAPLLLITLGASGAWIGQLTSLKAYQPLWIALTFACLGYGFWLVYGNPKPACDDETCATPASGRIVKAALWTASVLILVAVTADLWAPFL